jgi:hypothetical protein
MCYPATVYEADLQVTLQFRLSLLLAKVVGRSWRALLLALSPLVVTPSQESMAACAWLGIVFLSKSFTEFTRLSDINLYHSGLPCFQRPDRLNIQH